MSKTILCFLTWSTHLYLHLIFYRTIVLFSCYAPIQQGKVLVCENLLSNKPNSDSDLTNMSNTDTVKLPRSLCSSCWLQWSITHWNPLFNVTLPMPDTSCIQNINNKSERTEVLRCRWINHALQDLAGNYERKMFYYSILIRTSMPRLQSS